MATPKSFVASVLTVAGGSVISQAIAFAALPFVTRLYPPDLYGLFVVFLAYGGIVSPIVCARFEVAITLPRRARSASALVLGSLAIACIMSGLTAAVVLTLVTVSPGFGGASMALLPVYVLLSGAMQVFSCWSARNKDYVRLSASRIAQSIVTAAVAIGAAQFFGAQATHLVLAAVAAQVVALAVLLAGLPGSGLAIDVGRRQVLRLLKHFRPLVSFNVPHVLSDAAQASGLPLLVSVFFGSQAAAYYAFSVRLMRTPLGLVSGAISQVYYPRAAAQRSDTPTLRREALRILGTLTLAALMALPLVLLAPDAAYTFAFGPAWSGVGAYLRSLSPWMLASFVAAPLSVLFLVKEKFDLNFYFALAGSALACALLGVAHLASASAQSAMLTLSLGMTAYVVVAILAEFNVIFGRGRRDA